jgi:transposase
VPYVFYVGLDISTKRIAICALDDKGQVVHRSQARSLQDMLRVLAGLPDRFEVCYEASCGYGHFHDLRRPLATRVLVAHPGQLRLIFRSKHKNDRSDAERKAKLLYLGEAPAVHVPSLEVRTWRELINCRSRVIAKRTRAKNTVRALLRCAGITPPKHPGLWTKKGLAWLRQLELPTASPQLRRDLLIEEIEGLIRQGRRVEQQLNRRAQQTPAVTQVRSIPGVGIRTAEAVAALLDDPQRFPNAQAVGSYLGLVPCQDPSGDKNQLGHITREGAPVVRQLVAEAAWQAQRRSPTVRAYFERARRKDPQRQKIALVATAHFLVRVMWALLKRGTVWQENAALARSSGSAPHGCPEADRGERSHQEAGGERVNESARAGGVALGRRGGRPVGISPRPCRRPGGSWPPLGPLLASSLLPGSCWAGVSAFRRFEGSTSWPRAGLRLHPEVRHGARRRRWCEWGQPHTLSWHAASAADAEWMSGKSRNRLAPVLTKASSWMSDRSELLIRHARPG